MPRLTINQKPVETEGPTSILEAAAQAGIRIPTLCHLKGKDPNTACMMCVVEDADSGRLLPSCSVPATEGLEILTDSERVRASRKNVLELMLSEHVGNCEGPCRATCPAGVDIPRLMTLMENGEIGQAAEQLRRSLVLPRSIERICTAHCELACRRGQVDAPVSISKLMRHIADHGQTKPPRVRSPIHRKVVVVGSGPCGLSCAFHLARMGYTVSVQEAQPEPGGELRYQLERERLPLDVLDQEVDQLREMGICFEMNTAVEGQAGLDALLEEYEAVALCIGKTAAGDPEHWGLERERFGILSDEQTCCTSRDRVFAGGDAVRSRHIAVQAVADGRSIAYSINQKLHERPVKGCHERFNSTIGCLQQEETTEFMKECSPAPRQEPAAGAQAGFARDEALRESARCLHCECLKPTSCKLRLYSEQYGAWQKRFRGHDRQTFEKIIEHPDILFEPGKCIRCGICIAILKDAGPGPGLAFHERGSDMRLAVPFRRSLPEALAPALKECVNACPTAALAFRRDTH